MPEIKIIYGLLKSNGLSMQEFNQHLKKAFFYKYNE